MIGWLAVAALAGEPEVEGAAELRAVETVPDRFVLEPDGRALDWGPVLDTRLRLHGLARWDQARAELEADVLSGQLFGATWSLPALDERGRHQLDALTLAGVVPRKALVGARLPWFDVELGLTTSHWGLGMVAHDGASNPLFGRSDFGDRVLRARLATAPFARGGERLPLFLLAAADRVVADDLARLSAGHEAWQGVLAALYDAEGPPGVDGPRRAGLYLVHRLQDADGRTRVTVADAFGDWTFAGARGPVVRAAAEGAVIAGVTEAARTYVAPERLPIRQGGLTTQLEVGDRAGRVAVHLNSALASGDAAPDDDRVTDFRFDRDLGVGMVLFDEVIGAIDLAAWRQATDPSLAATPPDGVDTLAAEGAFHAAFAVQPAVEVSPLPFATIAVGGLAAWSTSPIAQAVTSFRAGGVPTNHLGRPSEGRYLGAELDWAVSTRGDVFRGRLRPSFALQGGHAWPSEALSGGVDRVDHLLLVARLRAASGSSARRR